MPFLLAIVVGVGLLGALERRVPRSGWRRGPAAHGLAAVSIVIGALLFAGSLARGHHAGGRA